MQIDLFVHPFTTGTGEEFYAIGYVFHFVRNVVDQVTSQSNAFGLDFISDAHLDVLSRQRQERHESANEILVDHTAVFETSCTYTYDNSIRSQNS